MQTCNARGIALSLDVPVSRVRTVLCDVLHCYAYKITHVQDLLPTDLPVKQTFAEEFLD